MKRFFVRFKDPVDRIDTLTSVMINPERFRPLVPIAAMDANRVLIADLSDEDEERARESGAELFEDVQFSTVMDVCQDVPQNSQYWRTSTAAAPAVEPWRTLNVNDVMVHNKATDAWPVATGKNVTIGIIDTGVAAQMPEFSPARQSISSQSFVYSSPWADPVGHGSMCACAAAGSTKDGGLFNGVAPDAHIMSLRSSLSAGDIYILYDWVLAEKRAGNFPGPVVLSNSYGLYTCSSPGILPQNHPYLDMIRQAVAEGICVIFAAGNNHESICNADPNDCSPNSIWGPNSIDEVLSVGTVNWDNRMDTGAHADSSRGPGEWAVAHTKPDCVAPTYGETVWGSGYQQMEWWGTSGACPQVAGLAALLLEKRPSLTPTEVYEAIRNSCCDLGLQPTCQGAGLIDCEAALALV